MKIKEALAAVNEMQSAGIIERYAIGGAVGATFYLEPVATVDIDIFISFGSSSDGLILSIQPIYDHLTARGARVDGEYLIIAGWPIQFLPATGALLEEALSEARKTDVDGVATRVFTAEHLAAIALKTGRAKDKARLLQFIEAGVLDGHRFDIVLTSHGLRDRWKIFQDQFLGGTVQ